MLVARRVNSRLPRTATGRANSPCPIAWAARPRLSRGRVTARVARHPSSVSIAVALANNTTKVRFTADNWASPAAKLS